MHQRHQPELPRDTQSQLQAASADLFLNAAAHGIVILHLDGTVLRANPAFAQIFGYTLEELAGRHLDEMIVPAEKIVESREFRKAALLGPHATISTQRRHRKGAMLEVSISGAPVIAEGTTIGSILLLMLATQCPPEVD